MPKSAKALINPALLVWARESSAMTIEEAAKKLQISVERLESWENGSVCPTVKQLQKASLVYKQSFAAFYLATPPEVFKPPLHDYRRLTGGMYDTISPNLSFDVRLSMDRRAVCLELYDEQNELPPIFELETTLQEDPEHVGRKIRNILGITIEQQHEWVDPRIAFNSWRNAIEAQGVLVFQSTTVQLPEMRGYSIAELPLPLIVVNRKDAYAGRIFTMLHEFVHLLLRSSGICDLDVRADRAQHDQNDEVFCNHAAGATLVPKDLLLAESIVSSHEGVKWEDGALTFLSRRFSVSREVILRRLLILGLTNNSYYELKRNQFLEEYRRRPKPKGFIMPDTNLLSSAGKPYVRLVLGAYHANRINATDVSDYLGVKLKYIDSITHELTETR